MDDLCIGASWVYLTKEAVITVSMTAFVPALGETKPFVRKTTISYYEGKEI